MIVLDVSIVVELLTNRELADGIREDLEQRSDVFLVRHLLDVEVASALRRLMADRRIDSYCMDWLLAKVTALPAD